MRGGFNGHDWGRRGQSAYHAISLPSHSSVVQYHATYDPENILCLRIGSEIRHGHGLDLNLDLAEALLRHY